MVDFVNNFHVFLTDFSNFFLTASQKLRNLWIAFLYAWVFIVKFLVFELWTILYFTFVAFYQDLDFFLWGTSLPTGAAPLDPVCFWIEDPSLTG